MKRIAVLVAISLLLLASPAWAITFTVSGSIVEGQYTEPTTNANGSALTDLAKTNVYYQIPGQSAVKGPNVPASALTGGGTITTSVTVPLVAGQEADVTFWVTASDTSGNESARSPETVERIDRLSPNPPQ